MPWTPLPGGDPSPTPIGQALDGVLKRVGAPPAQGVDRVFDGWDELAGPTLAAAARPVSLRDGVLLLAVDDPAWATQVRFLESELVARLAEAAPEAGVERVEVRVRGARDTGRAGGR